MARVPCAPVPDTGRQGILKYVILLPWNAKPRNPTEVVHVWTTIQSKFRCCPHPPFRPGLADQTGSPLASRDMRAAVMLHKVQAERLHGKPYQTYPRIRVRLQHSSAHRYPAPPPSWQHCPRVPESLRQRFVDFPRWTLDLALRFPLSSSSPARNEINY